MVRALSSHTLQVTWDPPLLSAGTFVRSYSLVFLKVSARQRTTVELFVSEVGLYLQLFATKCILLTVLINIWLENKVKGLFLVRSLLDCLILCLL